MRASIVYSTMDCSDSCVLLVSLATGNLLSIYLASVCFSDLSHNYLTHVPPGLVDLKNLAELYVSVTSVCLSFVVM